MGAGSKMSKVTASVSVMLWMNECCLFLCLQLLGCVLRFTKANVLEMAGSKEAHIQSAQRINGEGGNSLLYVSEYQTLTTDLAQKTTELPPSSGNWGHSQCYLIHLFQAINTRIAASMLRKTELGNFLHGRKIHTADKKKKNHSWGIADLDVWTSESEKPGSQPRSTTD